jgi:hypothetical protein
MAKFNVIIERVGLDLVRLGQIIALRLCHHQLAALTKLNIEARRQLKRLAIDKDRPVSELQCEAINLLFAKHGLPQIAKRWLPED